MTVLVTIGFEQFFKNNSNTELKLLFLSIQPIIIYYMFELAILSDRQT